MSKLENQYLSFLKEILETGKDKDDRTGTGTLSIFGHQMRHNMSDGFPLLTTKKMYWSGIVTELIWFLKGETNIKWLVENKCNIWNGDAYKKYVNSHTTSKNGWAHVTPIEHSKESFINKIKTDVEFAKEWGELGPIYGSQWRGWSTFEHEYGEDENGDNFAGVWKGKEKLDQIEKVIHQLKTNPDDRGIIVSAWNVGELENMTLRPCHNFFQFYTNKINGSEQRELSVMFNMRSNDVPLGLPFNIASYALLLEIISKIVDMIPRDVIVNIGDGHIYKNQVDGVKEQLTREPRELPKITMSDELNFDDIDSFLESCKGKDLTKLFKIVDYDPHPPIKIPLSN